MTASLQALPGLSTGIDLAALSQGDDPLNQDLTSSLSEFGPILQQAVGALVETPVVTPEVLEPLPQPLQDLPQEGKLLPLLQQVLDIAATEGTDAPTLIHDISAKLKALSEDVELEPEQAVATAIQQVIDENPRLAASVNTDLLRGLPGYTPRTLAGESGARSHNNVAQQLPAAVAQANTDVELPEIASPPSQRSLAGQGRPGGEFMPGTPVQHEDLTNEATALFSRLVSQARSAGTAEMLPRSDNLLTTLGSMTPTPVTTSATPPSTALPSTTLSVPFNQAGWDKALGERVQWMAGQGIQRANIKLNPAHLGPMEIRIQIQNDQANVQFTSAHGVVRDALEAALPRLREMFDNAGVELTDVDVSGQSFAEQQQAMTGGHGSPDDPDHKAVFDAEGEAEITLETPAYLLPESGRLDLFA